MSRRKGRIIAFQGLYSFDVGNEPLDEILTLNWTEDKVSLDQDTTDFARIIIAGTINHIDEVDALIKSHLSAKWDFSRVNRVSVAILRISVYALLYQKETAPSIIIDEAVGISKEYGADDAYKFINAVLDTIRKEIQS